MTSFSFYNPVKIYFGEDALSNLTPELEKVGKNILLTYGGGSIKRNGIYDKVVSVLKEAGKSIFELGGIMPNPRTEKVQEGIEICKKEKIDFILAVGGGSVIDCTKFISAGTKLSGDFWQRLFIQQEPITDALPFGVILTMAATGSEMNTGGVITNWDENLKLSYGHPLLYPKFSVLDPTYTYTMPKMQMIYGCVDILSHIFEVYFSAPDESNVSDDLAEALIKNVMVNLDAALLNPKDYTARSNIMWDSTLALNGLIGLSKEQDWMAHQIEHALSAFYDIPHGAGLAIVHPAYLKYICQNQKTLKKFVRFAKNIWHIEETGKNSGQIALEGIEKTREYFKRISAPITLKEVGIPAEAIDRIVEKINPFPTSYADLTNKDLKNILLSCVE